MCGIWSHQEAAMTKALFFSWFQFLPRTQNQHQWWRSLFQIQMLTQRQGRWLGMWYLSLDAVQNRRGKGEKKDRE